MAQEIVTEEELLPNGGGRTFLGDNLKVFVLFPTADSSIIIMQNGGVDDNLEHSPFRENGGEDDDLDGATIQHDGGEDTV